MSRYDYYNKIHGLCYVIYFSYPFNYDTRILIFSRRLIVNYDDNNKQKKLNKIYARKKL